jgi:cytochrome c peroxidase
VRRCRTDGTRRAIRRTNRRLAVTAYGSLLLASQPLFGAGQDRLDAQLRGRLAQLGFTGDAESTLETLLGRPVDPRLANIGRLLWFDTVTGLHGDNSGAGCHSPTNGLGDSQPIAIGIDNNGIVAQIAPGRGTWAARQWS